MNDENDRLPNSRSISYEWRTSMFQSLYPTESIDSVYEYDFEKMYSDGYRAILFDIDNTLVRHKTDQTPQSMALLNRLRDMGYGVLFISNGSEKRVKSFADPIGMKYLYRANKPSASGYRKAMEMLGSTPETTLFMGDQLFTDILGANRAKVHSVLVRPIDKKEDLHIVIKRYIERIILAFYRKDCKKKALKTL